VDASVSALVSAVVNFSLSARAAFRSETKQLLAFVSDASVLANLSAVAVSFEFVLSRIALRRRTSSFAVDNAFVVEMLFWEAVDDDSVDPVALLNDVNVREALAVAGGDVALLVLLLKSEIFVAVCEGVPAKLNLNDRLVGANGVGVAFVRGIMRSGVILLVVACCGCWSCCSGGGVNTNGFAASRAAPEWLPARAALSEKRDPSSMTGLMDMVCSCVRV